MKIFKDKNLTQEIEILDFDIIPAGETQQFKFWVLNDSSAYLKNLEFTVLHQEVKIISAPKELPALGSDELIIEWSPSITLKEGLRANLRVNGTELWG